MTDEPGAERKLCVFPQYCGRQWCNCPPSDDIEVVVAPPLDDDDLLNRLKTAIARPTVTAWPQRLLMDATDEIERLRAVIAERDASYAVPETFTPEQIASFAEQWRRLANGRSTVVVVDRRCGATIYMDSVTGD